MLCNEISSRGSIEQPGPCVFVIGKIISSFGIEVLDIGGVACRTHIDGRSPRDLCQARPRGYLAICVVSKLWSRVVHLTAHLLVLVCAWTGVLAKPNSTFSRYFWEWSGSLGWSDEARWSSIDLLESYFPGPGMKPKILESFSGPPSCISWVLDGVHLCRCRSWSLWISLSWIMCPIRKCPRVRCIYRL